MPKRRLLALALLLGVLLATACSISEPVPSTQSSPPVERAEPTQVPELPEPIEVVEQADSATGLTLSAILDYDCDAEERWAGGLDFLIFMQPQASPEAIAAISEDLANSPIVASHVFLDQAEAYAEFLDIFRDSEQIRSSVQVEDIPPNFRVALVESAESEAGELAATYRSLPDVFEVTERPKICEAGYLESLALCEESDDQPSDALVFLNPRSS